MAEARRLSDPEWLAICAATKLTPDADARAEIERCLFVEYPALAYDAKRVAAAHRRWRRILNHYEAIAELHRELPAQPDDVIRERDLFYLNRLHRRARAHVLACEAIRRANKGRSNPQHAWLISRLCGIWLDNFNAPGLGVSVPNSGGPPGGPLINFLLPTMRLILPKLPPTPTLRDAIDRERKGRESVRQLVLDLKQREHAGLTRGK